MTVKNGKNGKHYDYDGFVEKFKSKKTTDDCYTPPEVYDVVLKHVREKYNIADDVPIVRPFYPGGDYENYDYPEGCVVVDNPPFSIFARILDFYTFAFYSPCTTLASLKIGCGSEKFKQVWLFSRLALLWLTPKIGCGSGIKTKARILFCIPLALHYLCRPMRMCAYALCIPKLLRQ